MSCGTPHTKPLSLAAGIDGKDAHSHFERGRVHLSDQSPADGAPPFVDTDNGQRTSSLYEGGSMMMSPQASCTREATRPSLGKAKSTSMPNVYAFLEVTTTGDDRCAYPFAGATLPAGSSHPHSRVPSLCCGSADHFVGGSMVVQVGKATAPLETEALDAWKKTLDASSAMRPAGAGGGCEILGLAAAQYRSTALWG